MQAVFDESTFLHCSGSWASIPAIEIGVLNIDEENIPSEDVESQQAPPAVEANPIWLHGGGYPYIPDNMVPGDQLPPGDPPVSPPSPSMSYMSSSRHGPPSQRPGSRPPSQGQDLKLLVRDQDPRIPELPLEVCRQRSRPHLLVVPPGTKLLLRDRLVLIRIPRMDF